MGSVYVVDRGAPSNQRVQVFSPSGQFLLSFGGDVVFSGTDDTGTNEQQTVIVPPTVSAGTFNLTVTSATGFGTYTDASDQISAGTLTGEFKIGDMIEGPGIPAATTIIAITGNTLTISNNTTSANPEAGLTAQETTAPIDWNAPATGVGSLQEKLEALPAIGAGNLTVTGGPGASGTPFTVTFSGGPFAHDDIAQMGVASSLTGGSASVATAVDGGGPEICKAASDICKVGTIGVANGEFGSLVGIGSYIAADTKGTATDADDLIYVGDQNRIQIFNPGGEYVGDLPNPEGLLTGSKVSALAVTSSGSLLVGREAVANVLKLNSSSGIKECENVTPVAKPLAVAADTIGNSYVLENAPDRPIRKFNPSCGEVAEAETLFPFFPTYPFDTKFTGTPSGLGTSSACLTTGYGLHASNGGGDFVRAWGPPPDEAHTLTTCPPPAQAPAIEDQAAVAVETDRAVVQATINPRFWKDTSYHVQYGTADCIDEFAGWGGGCVQSTPVPDALLEAGAIGSGAKTAKIVLAALLPGTEYRYRFVAQSRFDKNGTVVNEKGGPVFGEGGTEAVDGADAGFITTGPSAGTEACANQTFRTGDSAFLPDCRAYEMVSPVDKNGGDINPPINEVSIQAAPDGNRLSYSAPPAFGDQASNKLSNQYLASRGAGGWSDHGINLPLDTQAGVSEAIAQRPPVSAFSEDLCNVWLADYNDPPLLAGAVVGKVNLYRQGLCESGGLELLTRGALLSGGNPDFNSVQGFSANLAQVFISANGQLQVSSSSVAAAPTANSQVYVYDRASDLPHLVSVLPDGGADPGLLTAGAEVGGGTLTTTSGPLEHAVSSDGSRVFWGSRYGGGGLAGRLYLRENPTQPQSAFLDGNARGKGDLSVITAGSIIFEGAQIVGFFGASGTFSVGDPIAGPGIPPGTTITAVTEGGEPGEGELEISVPATASSFFEEITSASKKVTNLATEIGAFEVGQEIVGTGIPAGTTVTACSPSCGPVATSLTLSASATANQTGTTLSVASPCTEPDKACTVPISQSGGVDDAFWGATPSGSKVLFSEGSFDPNAPGNAALYTFDVESRTTTQVAAGVMGVLGASDDLSRMYYVSSENLTPGQLNKAGEASEEAQAGEPNLYLDEEGTVTFIGTLLDGPGGDLLGQNGSYGVGTIRQSTDATRVTPDGGHIVFEARAPLTGFDNGELDSGDPMVEVFAYEAGGALDCVSCDPRGVRSNGRELPRVASESAPTGIPAAAWIPGRIYPLHAPRVLADKGGRVFFNSFTPLVSHDQNGAADVYEWEAPGEGSCDEDVAAFHEQNGGCLYLISSGESPTDSEFWEASADGRDVFFNTASSLLPQDPGLIDVYDARVEGGFPQSVAAAECEGEACQSPPAPPAYPVPSSSAYAGPGDPPKRPRCREGKVRRKGRCVARKHRKHATHQRSAKHNRGAAR
jgi:hypothetical protein